MPSLLPRPPTIDNLKSKNLLEAEKQKNANELVMEEIKLAVQIHEDTMKLENNKLDLAKEDNDGRYAAEERAMKERIANLLLKSDDPEKVKKGENPLLELVL